MFSGIIKLIPEWMLNMAWSYFTVIVTRQGWEDNPKTDVGWAADSCEEYKKLSGYVQ
jgi:hypothetical protein